MNDIILTSVSDADPKEVAQVYNSNPDYIEVAELFTGITQLDLDKVALYLWQELNRENARFIEIRIKETNKLVGICNLVAPSDETHQPWIGNLLIHGDYHHRGIGTKALKELVEQLNGEKWEKITTSILKPCEKTKEFYEKNGFKLVRDDIDQDKREVWIMERML